MKAGYSIQEQVYDTLRQNILNMRLEPGASISTQELADKLGVSRTPVREAFIRLQRDGLVISLPQRETVVSPIDVERAMQERFMRKSLEMAVLEPFMHQKTFAQLQQLNELIEKQLAAGAEGKSVEMLGYDDAFHQLFFDKAGQKLSWDVLEQMNTHYRRVRLLTAQDATVVKNIVLQHVDLLRMIENNDLDGARRVLDEHLKQMDWEVDALRTAHPDYFATIERGPRSL